MAAAAAAVPPSPEEVSALCEQLAAAAAVMMSPTAPREERLEAFRRCEDFKRSSPAPAAARCGLTLAAAAPAPVLAATPGAAPAALRHFGLKLLEDVIRLRWNEMSPEEKALLRESAVRMASEGTGDLLAEAAHIKDGVSRLVVEIAKREWPQQWPTLFSELETLCARGETQAEMAMLVLLRLVEDVAVLQTLEQNQRRREIYQALTANMDGIFAFLLQLLERHYQAYQSLGEEEDGHRRHGKVCRAVLDTLSALVEWVAMSHIMARDRYLLRCLCHLLSDPGLQASAADCLLGVVGWKAGKPADRMQLMAMFRTETMAPLFQAAEKANGRALEERHYNFLKKVVQILSELGGQLCALWTRAEPGAGATLWEKEMGSEARPENFQVYLNALLAFLDHPSLAVNYSVAEVWVKLLRHQDISRDAVFAACIPKFVPMAIRKCLKAGAPSASNHPSCSYSALDFDTDEEFSSFFGRLRIVLLDGIKLIRSEQPALPFQHAELWLKKVLLSSPPPPSPQDVKRSCSELDAVAVVLDAVLGGKPPLEDSQLDQLQAPAIDLARLCLADRTADPTFASSLLSCLSALFPVVGRTSDSPLLAPALERIFSFITYGGANFSPGAPASRPPMPEDARSLRRHGCALMIKLATRQPATLLPLFPQLRDKVLSLRAHGDVSQMEYCALVESLVLVSNESRDYQFKLDFLRVVVEPVWKQLTELETALRSSAAFAEFIGLNQPCLGDADLPATYPPGDNRGKVSFCLTFLLSVCRRSQPPPDLASCQAGGFILSSDGSSVRLRNPAWQAVAPALCHVFYLARTMNGLWAPAVRSAFHPDYSKVLELMESERVTIFGMGSRLEESAGGGGRSQLSRVQAFIFETYENIYHLLSEVANFCGGEFYDMPGLSGDIVNSVLSEAALVPDYRLRAVVRIFLKFLVQKCPRHCYSSVLAPVLQALCPYMLERLASKWEQLRMARESPSFDEDDTNSKEVIDDVVCRHLTREYLDVLKTVLTSGGGSDIPVSSFSKTTNGAGKEVAQHESEGAMSHNPNTPGGGGKLSMSELGHLVVQHESLGQCVTMTVLRGLLWPDSPSSMRAGVLLELMLPVLLRSGRLGDAGASQVMVNLLSAINQLGQHELNYIQLVQLTIQAYEWMRPGHPGIVEVLAQVPGCNSDDLRRFDDRMVQSARAVATGGKEGVKGGDRAKKDMFRKLIGQFIGRDVAHMFRQEIVIKNLPTLMLNKPERKKTPGLLDESAGEKASSSADTGIGSLFSQNGT